ncbi:MAG: Asp-tRNA(Asn)/Glu-tRNA(Gln) amidotransferase subunit GatC [Patescibacteria group bacterium]|nr:MAG: Asp-tRNA(Asn)/Glu-tRNA(Gln) amidotransferase subunit GatC [Patescibacteria group bacterium]
MSKVPKLDIEYIAHLAHLHLTASEKKKFSKQLSDILAHINKLGELNLDEVEPTFQTTGITDAVREDKAEDSRVLSQKEALSNAPETERGFFRVPKIL